MTIEEALMIAEVAAKLSVGDLIKARAYADIKEFRFYCYRIDSAYKIVCKNLRVPNEPYTNYNNVYPTEDWLKSLDWQPDSY